ncbi:DUF2793 domain-containing protein [Pseudogemmobacter sonorensis]|uniref:DUF2793 domain-containing protein n=1 Tax=Pseudogemmobacter sonorensis TaxID=2989681 RepID=UPI0036A8062D
MSDATPLLGLPLILPAQAQKHVTHNEALRMLDITVQLSVLDRDRNAPPETPAEGDRHLVATTGTATGDWVGQENSVATFLAGAWLHLAPQEGWRAWVAAEGRMLTYGAGGWSDGAAFGQIGVNAAADATNRLAVSSPATLLNHAGGGHQLKLNKAASTDTASLLFQSQWSGRAEMGLAGSDAFSIKVSPDGASFHTTLEALPATGRARLPNGAEVTGQITGSAVTQSAQDTTPGRLTRTGDGGLLGAPLAAPANIGATDGSLPPGAWMAGSSGAITSGLPAALAGAAQVYLFHHRRGPEAEMQILLAEEAAAEADRGLWLRRRSGAAWGGWKRLFDWTNIVGPVSQSGGTPSGAVIERGTNANGAYTRFADGTQICTRDFSQSVAIATAAPLGGFVSAGTAVTWAAAFAAAPVVSTSVRAGALGLLAGSVTASGATLSWSAISSQASAARGGGVIAVGAWF